MLEDLCGDTVGPLLHLLSILLLRGCHFQFLTILSIIYLFVFKYFAHSAISQFLSLRHCLLTSCYGGWGFSPFTPPPPPLPFPTSSHYRFIIIFKCHMARLFGKNVTRQKCFKPVVRTYIITTIYKDFQGSKV